MKIYVKGWSDFQHYKHRSPPWIKMHKSLLDNFEFQCLPIASKALAPMLWLLASESDDGSIDADLDKLAFRLRWNKTDINLALNSLIERGFIIDDSNVLASCKQDAMLEKSREELETEKETEGNAPQKKSARGTRLPDDWIAPDDYIQFCINERPDLDAGQIALQFKDYWIALSGSRAVKTDWFATWRNWVRRQEVGKSKHKNKSAIISDGQFDNWLNGRQNERLA